MSVRISISQDGVWAGTGHLSPEGTIEDCQAVLGPDGLDHTSGKQQAAAERAYAGIEAAIAEGRSETTVDGVRYSWALVPIVDCQCGRITGEACQWSGDVSETVEIEWMPRDLRATHEAAGGRGWYPADGSERLRVERTTCAPLIVETEGRDSQGRPWARILL